MRSLPPLLSPRRSLSLIFVCVRVSLPSSLSAQLLSHSCLAPPSVSLVWLPPTSFVLLGCSASLLCGDGSGCPRPRPAAQRLGPGGLPCPGPGVADTSRDGSLRQLQCRGPGDSPGRCPTLARRAHGQGGAGQTAAAAGPSRLLWATPSRFPRRWHPRGRSQGIGLARPRGFRGPLCFHPHLKCFLACVTFNLNSRESF